MNQKSDQQSYSHLFFIEYYRQKLATELLVELSQPALRGGGEKSFCCCNPEVLLVIRMADSQIS